MFGLLLCAGCAGKRKSLDVCANGACDEVPSCELGTCMDDGLSSLITSHSAREAVFDEDLEGMCPYPANEIPPLETLTDDSGIPEFDRARARGTNMNAGHEFLQEHELHAHLLTVQSRLFECLDLAACYEDQSVGTGELDFDFELEPTGRVSAVSVRSSERLRHPLIRACARRSLFESQFPTWEGGRMVVSYSVEIDEST